MFVSTWFVKPPDRRLPRKVWKDKASSRKVNVTNRFLNFLVYAIFEFILFAEFIPRKRDQG